MMFKPIKFYRHPMVIILAVLLLPGCQPSAKKLHSVSTRHRLNNLLVVPIKDMYRLHGENVTIRSPLDGRFFTTGKVQDGADRFLTEKLNRALKRYKGIRLIPPGQAEGVFAQLLSQSREELPELEMILKTGRSLDADAVLLGYVYRFRTREGTSYAVGSPASVAFDLDLVGIKERRVIWHGRFNETQQPLTEDLFQIKRFFKRRGRWISAWDMAEFGLEEVLQTFPVQ
jgi:hypothetical protein